MENAGKFVAAAWVTDEDKVTRYEQGMSFSHPGGNVADWTEFNVNLDIPSDIVEIEAYFRHYPPDSGGEGRIYIDDVSFIQWDTEPPVPIGSAKAVDLVTPNGWEFVRCQQDNNQEDMDVDITITGRDYQSRRQNSKSGPHLRQR